MCNFGRRKKIKESVGYLCGSLTKGEELFVNIINDEVVAWSKNQTLTVKPSKIMTKRLVKTDYIHVRRENLEVCDNYYLDFGVDTSATLTVVLEITRPDSKIIPSETKEKRSEKVDELLNILGLSK